MLFGDAYIKLKLESCRLKGLVLCVCGMPQSPVVIFEHDGCYYTRCQSCSATLAVSSRVALLSEEPHHQERDPGVWINYNKSDLFLVFYCVCGNERQLIGCHNELPPCNVCKLQFLLPRKLEVRELPRDYAFDCAPDREAGGLVEWNDDPQFRAELRRTAAAEAACEVVSDLPDVSAKVAAFKENPYHFLAATMNETKTQKSRSETPEKQAEKTE